MEFVHVHWQAKSSVPTDGITQSVVDNQNAGNLADANVTAQF